MQFLPSHWHCIIPAVAILIGVFFMNRDKPKDKDKAEDHGHMAQNMRNYKEEQDNV
jgi:hypothetical protein